jgi:MFS family permease
VINRDVPHPSTATGRTTAGLALLVLVASMNTSLVNVTLPAISDSLDAGLSTVQWVLVSYLLAVTIAIFPAGRLGDLHGRARLLWAGTGLFAVGSIACALAPDVHWLVGARVLQGIGAGTVLTLALALGGVVAPKGLAAAMGLFGTMSAVGTAVGPALGGALLEFLSWRAAFWVNLPLLAAAVTLFARQLPAGHNAQIQRFDWAGGALLAMTLVPYVIALTGKGTAGWLAVAMVSLALLYRVEKTSRHPLVPLELMRNPSFVSNLATSGIVAAVLMATLVVGPFFLGEHLALTAGQVGLAMSVGPLAAAVTSTAIARFIPAFGTRALTILGLVAMFNACLSLLALPAARSLPGYIASTILMTVGYAVFQTANNTALMRAATPATRGGASGLLNLARNLGLVTGAALFGLLYRVGGGDGAGAGPLGGLNSVLLVASPLLALALLLAWKSGAPAPKTFAAPPLSPNPSSPCAS